MGARLVPTAEQIASRIALIRGQKVLIDSDLATLYGVETRALNQAVKRNAGRFPPDFMFRLSASELATWRSQLVISNPGAKMGLRHAPLAFTEHGALMAATVLNSTRAVEASLYVVRAFIRMRQILEKHKDLARKLEEHDGRLARHDLAIADLLATIRRLMTSPAAPAHRPIGFVLPDEKKHR